MSENNINLIFAVTNPVVRLYQVRSSAAQHFILFKFCGLDPAPEDWKLQINHYYTLFRQSKIQTQFFPNWKQFNNERDYLQELERIRDQTVIVHKGKQVMNLRTL